MAVLTIEDCVGNRSPGRMLRRIQKLVWPWIEDRFDAADISFVQWVALKSVHEDIVTNAGELAREMDLTTGATTRLIDVLEERGWMLRDRGGADRRVVRLEATAAGYAKVMEVAPLVVGAWNELLADFSEAEVDMLAGLLRRLLDSVQRHAAPVREDAA